MIHKFISISTGVVFITLLNLYYLTDYSASVRNFYDVSNETQKVPQKYLINTTNCQIPYSDPFSEDIIKLIRKEEYTNCTNLKLLTYIEKESDTVTLNVNTSLLPHYSSYKVTCCYSEIHRLEGNDNEIRYTPCLVFYQTVAIFYPFIKVVCRNIFFMKVYENVHAVTMLYDFKNTNSLNDTPDTSILFVGIDSMSKQSIRRTMPQSYNFLENNFINIKGYNKIEDNTFPNLMAILTGENMDQLENSCPFSYGNKNLENEDFLSKCHFIWRLFKRLGYITAFGEDACPLSTFNFAKSGFPEPPTDYYYRPYFLAAEALSSVKSKCHNRFCSGPENSGERIFNSAKDFSVTYRNTPTFGFFWTNTFSHDNINCPSAMDEKVLEFLSNPEFINSLNNTIFIFFSDHGYRFGEIRQTNSGWLEERLPFMYLRVPDEFQKRFPNAYQNVLSNSDRLTTPYDVYNTLQHILKLSNNNHQIISSLGCPKCSSLFEEIPENRTCEEADIAQHWCTCNSYSRLPTTDPILNSLALFVIKEVNSLIERSSEEDKCAVYSYDKVLSAGISEIRYNENGEELNYVLLMVRTYPKAIFEATIKVPVARSNAYKIVGGVSRIDRYGSSSSCIKSSELKKYCYCKGFLYSLKNKFCFNFDVC